jgi:hypothetical protein
MDKDRIKQLYKICDSNSVLVVSKKGIYRLFCPFKAECIEAVDIFQIGQVVTVVAVKMTNNFRMVYIIQNKGYLHHYFMITSRPTRVQTSFN